MNIFSKRLTERLAPIDVTDVEEETGPKGRKSLGPQKVRWMTNGQLRRQAVRTERAAHRKNKSRYRRNWMRNEQLEANLRGQVAVLTRDLGTPALRANAAAGLAKKFPETESLDEALEAARFHLGAVARQKKVAVRA